MSAPPLRIASRSSALARTQTEWLAERIGPDVTLVWIKSQGDQDAKTPLKDIGGGGLFTAALHAALVEDRADAAVHSLKDLPVELEGGITLSAVPVREDPRDALVSRGGLRLASLPKGATVATGSPRRAAQVKRFRPDLNVVGLRGNVDTRLQRVREGRFDAVVLALAGLRRLGREEEVTEVIDLDVMLPAAGQGALGITSRLDDAATEARVRHVADPRAAAATAAERAALHGLGAGCHAPVGTLAEVEGGRIRLRVRVLSLDGSVCLDERDEGGLGESAALGHRVAARLVGRGAGPLVAAR